MGRGHTSLSTDLDTWHSNFRGIGNLLLYSQHSFRDVSALASRLSRPIRCQAFTARLEITEPRFGGMDGKRRAFMGERFGKIQAPRELTRAGGQMATPAGQQPPAAKHVATEVGVRRGRIAASDKKGGAPIILANLV